MQKHECPKCESVIYTGQKFCEQCGMEVETEMIECPSCKEKHFPNTKFCTDCGENIHKKSFSKFTKFMRIIFTLFIIFLVINIALQSNTNSPSFKERLLNVFQKKSSSEIVFREDTTNIGKYKELSFDTMIFSKETTNEVELEVPGPTNQLFMKEAVKNFLKDINSRINDEDILEIKVYEEKKEERKTIFKAHFIYVNLDVNKDYSFPEGGYQNLGEWLYVKWQI
jgi:predicted nucleic acid-binding Zn ribbon protein